jgi:hypothetical protein
MTAIPSRTAAEPPLIQAIPFASASYAPAEGFLDDGFGFPLPRYFLSRIRRRFPTSAEPES